MSLLCPLPSPKNSVQRVHDTVRAHLGWLTGSILATVMFLVVAMPIFAATITVQPDGSGDAATIAAAVKMSTDGDVVSLASGVFQGDGNRDVSLMGKAIRIESEAGDAASCTIDCEGSETDPHRAFVFTTGEGSSSVIANVSITGGFPPVDENGGAILVRGTSPRFDFCIFENNASGEFFAGGSVACEADASPTFQDCTFKECTGRQGGAVAVLNSSATFESCRFEGNEAAIDGGAIFALTAELTIRMSTFSGNAARFGAGIFMDNDSGGEISTTAFIGNSSSLVGGALVVSASDPVITECTFVGNGATSFDGMGGGAIWCSFDAKPQLDRCLIAFQFAGAAVVCDKPSSKLSGPELICCDLFGNEGGDYVGQVENQLDVDGNFSSDPLFCERENGDFTVAENSPCLPEGNDCSALIGRFGKGCEAVPVLHRSWGQIKEVFSTDR